MKITRKKIISGVGCGISENDMYICFMKITREQIKGKLKERVDIAIADLEAKGFVIIAYFAFTDVDHQYAWRSKGKFIAIRYKTPECGFQQYHDKNIYYS